MVILGALLVQSCSTVYQYSTFKPIVGVRDTTTKVLEAFMCFDAEDSILFYVASFDGGKMVLFGPPYLPIVPNIFYPFTFFSDNKKQSYRIILYSADSINMCNIDFYRNKKKIEPVAIDVVTLTNPKYNNGKIYDSEPLKKNESDCILYPNMYYQFSFSMRTFTTKEIEIKYNGKTILHVQRKKKLKFENDFTFAS